MARRIHGVIKPTRRGNVPARVLNVQSKRRNENRKIRLDKLIKSEKPIICIKRRLGGIGDVIMTTPLLKAIKRLLPNCHLIYATDLNYANGALADVISHNPYVDSIISNEKIDDSEYDYFVDVTATGLHKEKAGSVPPNRIDMFAEEVGISIEADPVPVYVVQDGERDVAVKRIEKEFLGGHEREDIQIIAIQARSNDARRTWPLDHVQRLVDLLAKDPNKRILLFDWGKSAGRWKSSDGVFPILDLELPKAAALIEQSDLVICPDSSLLHLAGALNKKIVSIFGPIPPESRINYYANADAINLNLPCHPCWYSPRCVRNNNNKLDCLTRISPEQVKDAALKKLSDEFVTEPNMKYGKTMTKVGGQDPIILVKRVTDGMGDLIMATTGIEALKKRFPSKKVHVAIKKKLHPVLENNPHIDAVLDIDEPINARRYYMIIDISYPCARYEIARLRSKKTVEKNRVEIFAEAIGTRELISDLKPRFHILKSEIDEGKMFLADHKIDPNKKTIAIATHSAELYRDWPKNHYEYLINIIKDKYNVVIIHSERTDFYANTVDACGLPLRRAAGILASCDGLVTVDTGLLHIAAAIDLPTIALFGPIDYKARCKGYKNTTVLVSDLPCIPCWRNATIKCKETNLVKSYSECMKKITPKQVAKVIDIKFK